MSRISLRRKAALGVVAVAGMVLALPGQAQAAPGPHYWMYTDDSNPAGGRVDFWTVGDIVQICDKQADGYRAVLNVFDGDRRLYHLEAVGNGVCNSRSASDGGVHDLAENHCLRFQVYLTDNGLFIEGSEDNAWWRNYNDAKANCG